MDDICDVAVQPLAANSRYIRPLTMRYKQEGVERSWDLMRVHDSVAVLVYNVTRRVFVFVRQFRPAVYFSQLPSSACTDMSQLSLPAAAAAAGSSSESCQQQQQQQQQLPGSCGITLELCAGCLDKQLPVVEVAREELLEECGYNVDSSRLKFIKTFRGSVGVCGSSMHLYYVEVSDTDRISKDGEHVVANEDERLETVEMSSDQVRQYVAQSEVISPAGFLYAIYWYYMHILHEKL